MKKIYFWSLISGLIAMLLCFILIDYAHAQESNPIPTDMDLLLTLISQTGAGYKAFGILGALSAFFYGLVKVWRTNLVQGFLDKISPKLVWNNWPKTVRILIVLLVPVLATLFTGLSTHLTWSAIITGILAALFGAITSGGLDGIETSLKKNKVNP